MEPWALSPDIIQLNHGSFGACPTPVLDEQLRWRDLLEANPTGFFMETYPEVLDIARARLAAFLGADPAGLVFVSNATAGVNDVLRSLESTLSEGDEIVVIDQTYNACRNAVEALAVRTGVRVVVAVVPFPIGSPDEALEIVVAATSDRTKLVLIDQVTSTTAVVIPVDRIVTALEPDIPVLVDAAHAPGMVPLHLDATGASYTAGNCHKWLCAPKGVGFLHVREDRREALEPSVISHGWQGDYPPAASRFHRMFDWTGTDDPSARLSVPMAIEVIGGLHPDGWDGVTRTNHDLVVQARRLLCDALDIEPPTPDDMLGSMATLPLQTLDGSAPLNDPLAFTLRNRWSIEVPTPSLGHPPRRAVRVSAQLYNRIDQYERLAEALQQELGGLQAS